MGVAFLILVDIDPVKARALALSAGYPDGQPLDLRQIAKKLALSEREVRRLLGGDHQRGRNPSPGAREYMAELLCVLAYAEDFRLLEEAQWLFGDSAGKQRWGSRFAKDILNLLVKAREAARLGWVLLLLRWTKRRSPQEYYTTLGELIDLSRGKRKGALSEALRRYPPDDDNFLPGCVQQYYLNIH